MPNSGLQPTFLGTKTLLSNFTALTLSIGLLLSCSGALGAPKSDLWDYWSVHDRASISTVNHHAWQLLLNKHVATNTDGINRVNYQNFSASDKTQLDAYITQLKTVAPTKLSRAEQLPYWINLYNALTVRVVLQHPQEDSIRDMKARFFSLGPWNEEQLSIEDRPITLNDIEHRILRPIWQDQRLHYVLNCASLGCPNLSTQAYTAENTPRQLKQAEQSFVQHPRAIAFTAQGNLKLSSIFDWYQVDFGGSKRSLLNYLAQQRPDLAAKLKSYSGSIDYHYDWSLNRQQQTND